MRAIINPAVMVGVYTFLAGITWVEGAAGQGFAGRVALPDIFGLLILLVALLQVFYGNSGRLPLPNVYRWYVPLLLTYFASSIFADLPMRALFELLVHIFILSISISIYVLLIKQAPSVLPSIFQAILYGASGIALIGILHFFFFPSLFSGSHGGLSGTFRNTGQAGSYFGLMLALLLPAYLSGLLKPNIRNLILLIVILVALFFTFKRAAMAGTAFGFSIFLGRLVLSSGSRQKMIAAVVLLAAIPIYFGFTYLLDYAVDNISGVSYRFNRKISADAVENFVDGFFAENYRASLEALKLKPLFGIGLSNAAGLVTERLEIHGSYFAVLAYGGVVGFVAYLSFLAYFLISAASASRAPNIYSRYLSYYWPFFLGLIGSWIYTYPLRKREFWIMLAVVCVIITTIYVARGKQVGIIKPLSIYMKNPGC